MSQLTVWSLLLFPLLVHSVDEKLTCPENTYYCFGIPADCAEDCEATVAVFENVYEDGLTYEVKSTLDYQYAAVGFSSDDKMGDEVVIDCLNQNGIVQVYIASNKGKKHTIEAENSKNLSQNGTITNNEYFGCSFQVLHELTASDFKIQNATDYYLLLAIGDLKEGALTHHKKTAVSKEPVQIILGGGASAMQVTIFATLLMAFVPKLF